MNPLPYSNLNKGTFLVASPDSEPGLFSRAVILLCEHNSSGSFGLIINKRLNLELPEELLNLQQLANSKINIQAGGPTQTSQMMLLHSSNKIPHQSIHVCDGVYLGGDLQFLQEAVSKEDGPNVKLCFGYTAWGPGQLEREFLDGDWFLTPASEKHVFHTPQEKMWQSILREMGGQYATLSMIPEDLSLN
ncbi:MAG: YqgE/AlgH family protein [Chlamydiales bacterium]|nr:YqgE/AlgH family protein [Chlamydiales bacterium]